MLGDWFDAREAVLMGVKLANDLSQELEKLNNSQSKKDLASRAKVIQKVFSKLDLFQQKTHLNFYKKSKLVNEFRWRLSEVGHDKELIQIVTQELVFYIN